MIKAVRLGKSFRKSKAVDNLSFEVETGVVTGFLGPNGAGKSTTMRLMLGLDNGLGSTTYDGKRLFEYARPSKMVGILLEAKAYHPTRTAERHLKVLATASGVPLSRVAEVLETVGLTSVAKKAPGKFSLGMSQRLGIAAAILSKPKYLLLDEPANGLDPEGIVWLREFLQDYAAKGNGVLVSSHLLNEMAQMAENVIVIAKGKLITTSSIKDLVKSSNRAGIFIRTSDDRKLTGLLRTNKLNFSEPGKGIEVTGAKTDQIGKLAFDSGITVLELKPINVSLEDVFLELTEGKDEYHAVKEGTK